MRILIIAGLFIGLQVRAQQKQTLLILQPDTAIIHYYFQPDVKRMQEQAIRSYYQCLKPEERPGDIETAIKKFVSQDPEIPQQLKGYRFYQDLATTTQAIYQFLFNNLKIDCKVITLPFTNNRQKLIDSLHPIAVIFFTDIHTTDPDHLELTTHLYSTRSKTESFNRTTTGDLSQYTSKGEWQIFNTDPAFRLDCLMKNALRPSIESIFFLMAAEFPLKIESWEIHQE